MDGDAFIHLRVPAATKGRWVRASRAAGRRLTDYITEAVEKYMKQQLCKILIPEDLQFSDLHLARDKDGHVSFDWEPIEKICQENNIPIELLKDGPEDNVAALIVSWYVNHRSLHGKIDTVAEDLISETIKEDKLGGGISFPPGKA